MEVKRRTYKFIRKTVQECLDTHEKCPKNVNVALPTFVLDVGLGHDALEPGVLENDGTLRGTYLTLT